MVRREGFEPPAFWSVGCLTHKSESFQLRFVLFATVRSADFPLFPSSPARFFRILGQKWVRGCNIRRDWRTATLRHSPHYLMSTEQVPDFSAVGTVIVHVLLLLIDGADRAQTFRLARGQIFSEGPFAIDGIQAKPTASQWLCGSFSRCVYGILCISGNLSGRVCGRFEASFRLRDREERPKAFQRSPWPR